VIFPSLRACSIASNATCTSAVFAIAMIAVCVEGNK
jgi:hypothetical protein